MLPAPHFLPVKQAPSPALQGPRRVGRPAPRVSPRTVLGEAALHLGLGTTRTGESFKFSVPPEINLKNGVTHTQNFQYPPISLRGIWSPKEPLSVTLKRIKDPKCVLRLNEPQKSPGRGGLSPQSRPSPAPETPPKSGPGDPPLENHRHWPLPKTRILKAHRQIVPRTHPLKPTLIDSHGAHPQTQHP